MNWPPEYVLDDMSVEVLALSLEGRLEAVDPERAERIRNRKEPDEAFALKLIEALKQHENGNKAKQV